MVTRTKAEKTSHVALYEKRVCVELGYYEDEFIDYFSEPVSQSPVSTILHYIRSVSIRMVVDLFVENFSDKKVQVVTLGGGLDTLCFYLLKKHQNVICFDTDLESQVKLKCDLMSDHKIFTDLLPDLKLKDGFYTSTRYKMIPVDLTRIEDFQKLIDSGLSKELPTIFVAEFSAMYVESEPMNKFLRLLSDFSNNNSVYFFTESFLRETDFGNFYYKLLTNFGPESIGPKVYRTLESQIKRYDHCFWKSRIVCYNDFYNHNFETEEKKRILKLENFEDMTQLGVFCAHLLIGLCYKNDRNISKILKLFREYNSDDNLNCYDIPFGVNYVTKELDLSYFRELHFDTLKVGRLIDEETMKDDIDNYFGKI